MDAAKLALELNKVKLKKVEVVVDTSAPKLQGFISEQDVRNYQLQVLGANLEEWIELIKEYTFETKFFPLTTSGKMVFSFTSFSHNFVLGINDSRCKNLY